MKLTAFTFLLFFILQFSNYKAQLKGSSYQFPEKFSPNYFFDPSIEYLKIKDIQVAGFTPEQLDLYKIKKIYNVQKDFDNNSFYLEWYDLEKYLKKLIDTILPIEIKNKISYNVFIRRDVNLDATALNNGFLFVDIGLLADCKSEAELAYVIAHKIGHSMFNQEYLINTNVIPDLTYTGRDFSTIYNEYKQIEEENRKGEAKSDSFAYHCLNKGGLNINGIAHAIYITQYYEYSSISYMNKIGSGSYDVSKKNYHSYTNYDEKKKAFEKSKKLNAPHYKNYIIDSLYFNKIKKIAHEECKKTNMELGNYKSVLTFSFKDYLEGDVSFKNLYYIFESTRRLMYLKPENNTKGFLAENFHFQELQNTNYSILKQPEILFSDSLEYVKASQHPLIKEANKPFNSYEEAYLYFIDIAEQKGFNESILSKGLYFYSKKDNINFIERINKYLEKGGGLFTDFANNLSINGSPVIKTGKTLVLIDNSTNFSQNDNYYHSLQRISFNNDIYNVFKNDTNKVELILMNELLGIQPRKLYSIQKIKSHLNQLYSEADEEVFYKKKYLSKESMDDREKRNKFNKNILILAPEFYKWHIENNINGILCQQIIYDYKTAKESNEYHNFYHLVYFNFIDNRPFFGRCIRTGNIRKQKPVEMASDAREYLFYKE